MRKFCALVGILAGFTAGVVLAQSDSDYQMWMKAIAASNGSLQKNIAAKNAQGVETDAKSLETNFKQVVSFWEKKKTADAVTAAKKAETAAAAVSKAAASGNFDEASAQAKTLASSCAECHMAHREKTATGFTIK